VNAADAAVNADTGTFTFEADFPNPDDLVLAGQFARVRAIVEIRKDALLVPSRSISELQGNFRVFVVGDEGSVEVRPVELGPEIGNLRIIESGVEPGERVAIEIIKLQPGMTVKPRLTAVDANGVIQKTRARSDAAAEESADSESEARG
jgi:membrane fusion protein (multidrug efflux system)